MYFNWLSALVRILFHTLVETSSRTLNQLAYVYLVSLCETGSPSVGRRLKRIHENCSPSETKLRPKDLMHDSLLLTMANNFWSLHLLLERLSKLSRQEIKQCTRKSIKQNKFFSLICC